MHVEIDRTPVELCRVRAWVADVLFHARIGAALTADVVLVASELVSNAVEAAAGGTIEVHLRVRDIVGGREIVLSVSNSGTWAERADQFTLPHATGPRGRGLAVCRSLTRHLSLRRIGGRTVATSYFRVLDDA